MFDYFEQIFDSLDFIKAKNTQECVPKMLKKW